MCVKKEQNILADYQGLLSGKKYHLKQHKAAKLDYFMRRVNQTLTSLQAGEITVGIVVITGCGNWKRQEIIY